MAARLGLPPRVDDRAALAADVAVVPHPRLGVDRLAHRAQHPQRRQVVAVGLLGAPLHEGADGGGRRVELGDPVALDDVPQAVLRPRGGVAVRSDSRGCRGCLVHDARGPVAEGPVDDVAVAGHPTDVGGAPVHVGVGTQVEHRTVGPRHLGEVAAGGVHDALGLRRRARGVEEVEQLLAVDRHRGAVLTEVRGGVGHRRVPPVVAAADHVDPVAAAAVGHHHRAHGGARASAASTLGLSRNGAPRR